MEKKTQPTSQPTNKPTNEKKEYFLTDYMHKEIWFALFSPISENSWFKCSKTSEKSLIECIPDANILFLKGLVFLWRLCA